MSWLPEDFAHPDRVALPTGHHLRPIRVAAVDLDTVAVTGSQERSWSIYVDPPEKPRADAETSWCVLDALMGSEVEHAHDTLLPQWIARDWPSQQPRYVGRDLAWAEWTALPEL